VKAAGQTVQGAFRPREDAVRRFDAAGNLVQTEESNSVRLVFGSFPDGSPRRTLYAVPNQEIEPTSASSLGVSGFTDGYGDALTTHGYRGDGRLVRVVRTASCLYLEATLECSRQVPDYHTQTRTETYRYDALGRRVWVKTVTPASAAAITNGRCAFRCDNTTRRTIWDGDQVLAEIRYPNGQGEQDTGLDSANVAALAARTERGVTAAGHPYGGLNTSDWAQHGRVLYVHAGGIDQPLGVVRMDYSYDFPAPTLVVPHASWRGVYESGTIVADTVCKNVWLPTSEMVYQDSSGHRLQSPVVSGPDGEELDRQQQRCFEVDFPGKAVGMRRLLRQNSVAGPVTWTGSLMQDNQDASGLMYRRNRFYDPKSGRFTQEDPIGLAGGVNAYGFAEGDPVSYGDPYGLKSEECCQDNPNAQNLELEVQAMEYNGSHPRESAALLGLGVLATAGGFAVLEVSSGAVAGTNLLALRAEYVGKVRSLSDVGRQMLARGEGEEAVARTLHTARRALGEEYKMLTPLPQRIVIYGRNLLKYGDRLGPTVNWLRSQGKSWADIIGSAARAGGSDLGL